jgi:N-acetylglucosamine malate deacetylase 1
MKGLTGLSVPSYRAPENRPLQILLIGAHPDDGEVKAAGTAALWSDLGHRVKIVSVTDGRCGHHEMPPEPLVARRRKEAEASARILGVTEEILPFPDAALLAGLEERKAIVRLIREWQADVVITHRPNDYHADHRYTSLLVQDASFLVTVPHFVPEIPRLPALPVFLYFQDAFQQPQPFRADVVVDIDSVADRKVDSFHAMPSQFLEWLPWNAGFPNEVPAGEEEQKQFIRNRFQCRDEAVAERFRQELIAAYGQAHGQQVRHAEAYQLCEYGSQPATNELKRLFPF